MNICKCDHCWHLDGGPVMMVIRPNHVIERCCHCDAIRQVHSGHRFSHPRRSKWSLNVGVNL